MSPPYPHRRQRVKRGPLRKIVHWIRTSRNIYDTSRVRLECGHETEAWGGLRARCEECADGVRHK